MRKHIRILMLSFLLTASVLPAQSANAVPITAIMEVIKAGVKKVIRAIDLKIQRLQNKTIWLQNAQKVIENAMSKLKLEEISEWSEKQRALYDDYFQELWKVKKAISTYREVRDIARRQAQIVEEFQRAWQLIRQDDHFTAGELDYIYGVYSGLLEESLHNLDLLLLAASPLRTQMSDGERLELIDRAAKGVEVNLADLRKFNRQNFSLSILRASDEEEAGLLKQMYGIE